MESINCLLLLVALGFVSVANQNCCYAQLNPDSFDDNLEIEYDQINKYLVDNIAIEEDELNFAKANDWFNQLKSTEQPDQDLLKALEQFLALEKLSSDHSNAKRWCKWDGYSILSANDKATGGRAVLASWKRNKSLNRVEKTIARISEKHANDCEQVYPVAFKDKMTKMDREKIDHVAIHLENLIQSRLENSFYARNEPITNNLDKVIAMHYTFVLGRPYIGEIDDAKVLYLSLEDSVLSNKDFVEKLDEIVNEHILEPCKYYTQELGPDIFVPADQDYKIITKRFGREQDVDSLYDFYSGWSRYRICSVLNENYVQKELIDNMQKIAKSTI